MNIHQDADVGLSHGIENQTGDGLGEEGVVGFGGEHALPGALQHHAPLGPPGVKRQDVTCAGGKKKNRVAQPVAQMPTDLYPIIGGLA